MRRVVHLHVAHDLAFSEEPFLKAGYLSPARGPGWVFGSNTIPPKDDLAYLRSPFPMDDRPSRIRHASRHMELTFPARVRVRALWAWQHYLEPDRIFLPLQSHAPIHVAQLDGRLIILNGNHRSAAAFAEGREWIEANVLNADGEGMAIRADEPVKFHPLSSDVEPHPVDDGSIDIDEVMDGMF